MTTDNPTNLTTVKSQISALDADQIRSINNIFHIRLRNNWLRTVGWVNLILGALTLWIGSAVFLNFSIPRFIQFSIGIIIFGQSIWSLIVQNNGGLLRFAWVFLIAGAWNIFLAINYINTGTFLTGLLGLMQLKWAYDSFLGYRRYQEMNLPTPMPEMNKTYDDMWHFVSREMAKKAPDLIQLWIGGLRWRALLAENFAVFASRRNKLLIIKPKTEINFAASTRNPMKKRRIQGGIILNTATERASMHNSDFVKYAEWKGLEAVISEIKPSIWERLPRAVRIIIWSILGLILAYIIFITIGVIQLLVRYS